MKILNGTNFRHDYKVNSAVTCIGADKGLKDCDDKRQDDAAVFGIPLRGKVE